MKYNYINIILVGLIFALFTYSKMANSTVITLGDISRDTENNVFIDNKTGNEWLSWDYNEQFNWEELQLATGVGGIYEDYQIATTADIHELFSNTNTTNFDNCSINSYDGIAGNSNDECNISSLLSGDYSNTFNAIFFNNQFNWGNQTSAVFYDNQYENNVEITGVLWQVQSTQSISLNNNFYSNFYSDRQEIRTQQVNGSAARFALVKKVPEPQTIFIFVLGIAGLFIRYKTTKTLVISAFIPSMIMLSSTNVQASDRESYIAQCDNHLLTVEANGKVSAGTKNKLIDVFRKGASIRVGWELDWNRDNIVDITHWTTAQFLTEFEGKIFAQIPAIEQQSPKKSQADILFPDKPRQWHGLLNSDGVLKGRYSNQEGMSKSYNVRSMWCIGNP